MCKTVSNLSKKKLFRKKLKWLHILVKKFNIHTLLLGGGRDWNRGEVHASYQGNGGGECQAVIGWKISRGSWTETSSLEQLAKSA